MRAYLLQLTTGQIVGRYEPPAVEGYVIGRTDDDSEYQPDIDLAAFEARDHGVSRRHLAWVSFNNKSHVIDLNSINGTYLNGRRLTPDIPVVWQPGDELRLGTLVLQLRRLD